MFYAACDFHDCPQRESRFGGNCSGFRGNQRKDLPDGTAVPLGKFQKDLCLRQGLSLTPKFLKASQSAPMLEKVREHMKEVFRGILSAIAISISAAALAEPAETTEIAGLLHRMFDKPGIALKVSPVVVAGEYAIADWLQGEMGGRALLRRKQQWSLILCAGDGIKSRDALAKAGVPADHAARLEQQLASAEAGLGSDEVAMFSDSGAL